MLVSNMNKGLLVSTNITNILTSPLNQSVQDLLTIKMP